MGAREKAVQWALDEVKAKRIVMMGMRGDLRFDRETRSLLPHKYAPLVLWDCSGLMCGAIQAGDPEKKDIRGVYNAQGFHDLFRPLELNEPRLPGDGVFFGKDEKHIIHIGIMCAGGKVISADGATWGVVELEQAKASPSSRVRLHENEHFRGDFVSVRRNILLDKIDGVSR